MHTDPCDAEEVMTREQAEQEAPRGLMALRFPTGLGVSFTPDESDLNGSVTYGHDRMTQLVAELFRRTGALTAQADQQANYVQGLPTREDYDALMADLTAAQQMIAALLERRAA